MTALNWWEPDSYPVALVLAVLATACWGSWSNTAKEAGSRLNFAHYYFDFCVGIIFCALVCWAIPGQFSIGHDHPDLGNIGYAAAAGAVFGSAIIVLTTCIAVVGLSVAFPLCIGTALVLGTILAYAVDPRGKPELIFPGVALALLGVITNAKAHGLLEQHRKDKQGDNQESQLAANAAATGPATQYGLETEAADEAAASWPAAMKSNAADHEASINAATQSGTGTGRNILMCIVGGVLMGCWAPLSARSMQGEEGLSPYFSFVCYAIATAIVSLSILVAQQNNYALVPLVDPPTSVREYFKVPVLLHGWGFFGGVVWALGTASNLVSSGPLGAALSYALGQTAPLVAVMWGVFWYREFDGAPTAAKGLLGIMFVLFAAAIGLLCASSA